MRPDKSRIPICHSDLLQDVTIELGKRLRAVRYVARGRELEFEVSTDIIDGSDVECLKVIRWEEKGSYIGISIWENHQAAFTFRRPFATKHSKAEYVRFRAFLSKLSAYEIADLIRNSLRAISGIETVISTWREIGIEV